MKKHLLLAIAILVLLAQNSYSQTQPLPLLSQSIYEETISYPAYNASNPAMMIINSVADWSHINDANIKYFYVKPGNYNSLGKILLNQNGTPTQKRYIIFDNGNNLHPGEIYNGSNASSLARARFFINSDYWVIDRMANIGIYDESIRIADGTHNTINRYFGHNSKGIGVYDKAHYNIIQNSRFQNHNYQHHEDFAALALVNYSGIGSGNYAVTYSQVTFNKFINNETYNYADGFQSVILPYRTGQPSLTSVPGTNYKGTIVDYNRFYIDTMLYTSGNGVKDVNGKYAWAENGIDLKVGSEDPANPMKITNNIMWGYKQSDTKNSNGSPSGLSDWGAAFVAHYGVKNTECSNNIMFNCDYGIDLSGHGYLTNSSTTMNEAVISGNIIYNIKRLGFRGFGHVNTHMYDNLFKQVMYEVGWWENTWGKNAVAGVESGVAGSSVQNFNFHDNMVVNARDLGAITHSVSTNPTYSNNTYFDAKSGAWASPSDNSPITDPTANYCDFTFYRDQFTSNPVLMTLSKVLDSVSCNPVACSSSISTLVDTACNNYYWVQNGQTYNASGIYSDTVLVDTCMQIYNLELTIDSCITTDMFLEAECANTVGGNWSNHNAVSASNSEYLQADVYNIGGAHSTLSTLTFNFNAATAGSYYFNTRNITANDGNAYYFRVNGGAWTQWYFAATTNFTWFKHGTPINLMTGANTLEISLRKKNLKVDKVAFTLANSTPSGMGGGAYNCATSPSCPTVFNSTSITACSTDTVNLLTHEPVNNQGGQWKLNGQTLVNYSVINTGDYTYTYNDSSCIHVDTFKVHFVSPDYAASISILPSAIIGTSNVFTQFKITELNNEVNCSDLYVISPKSIRLSVNYNDTLSTIAGKTVQNSDWQLISSGPNFYMWKYIGNGGYFAPGGVSTFGFIGVYSPNGTNGSAAGTLQLFQGSGGDNNNLNNTDSDILIYYK